MKFTNTVIGILLTLAQPLMAANSLLDCGHLFDSQSAQLKGRTYVLIENNTISQVSQDRGAITLPEATQQIDLSDATCLPGLMDMHTHISSEYSPRYELEKFKLNAADYAIKAGINAEKTLMAGFTTVRDLGDAYNVTVSIRNAIDRGKIPGPRILTATKSLASTGGHADASNGRAASLRGKLGPEDGIVNSVDDAKAAVRHRYQKGADVIKITSTGGVLSVAKNGDNPQFTIEEIKAIVDTANDYGFHVAAHAHGKEGIRRAIIGGVLTIEHGSYMDKELFRLMKKHGTYLVPTLMAGDWVADKAKIEGFFPEVVRPKAQRIGPLIKSTFTKAYQAGVNIVFGTDSGVSSHGDNAKEFIIMVESGMPAAEALQSATYTAAALLKLDQLGEIAERKWADIIAVKGNPLDNIELMTSVSFVMKAGKVYKRDQ